MATRHGFGGNQKVLGEKLHQDRQPPGQVSRSVVAFGCEVGPSSHHGGLLPPGLGSWWLMAQEHGVKSTGSLVRKAFPLQVCVPSSDSIKEEVSSWSHSVFSTNT